MAPKTVVDVPEALPTEWVPHLRCVNFFKSPVLDKTLEHSRGGHSDAAHGAVPITEGHHRITYRIQRAMSTSAFGMVLGVADCSVWDPPLAMASKEIHAIFNQGGPPLVTPQRVAWGLCPSSGRLIETHDVRAGHLQGAKVGQQLAGSEQNLRQSAVGATVVVEVNMMAHDEDTAGIARRDFDSTFHPLTLGITGSRRKEPPPPQRYNTLAFSINGGELVQADVRLPAAVWPWVLLNWEGDAVTLVGVDRLDDPMYAAGGGA